MRNIGSPQLGQSGLSFTPKLRGFPNWSRINRAPRPDLKTAESNDGNVSIGGQVTRWNGGNAKTRTKDKMQKSRQPSIEMMRRAMRRRGEKECPGMS